MNEPDRRKGMQVPVDLDSVHRLRAQLVDSLGKSQGCTHTGQALKTVAGRGGPGARELWSGREQTWHSEQDATRDAVAGVGGVGNETWAMPWRPTGANRKQAQTLCSCWR